MLLAGLDGTQPRKKSRDSLRSFLADSPQLAAILKLPGVLDTTPISAFLLSSCEHAEHHAPDEGAISCGSSG